jgi:hypothetical protein
VANVSDLCWPSGSSAPKPPHQLGERPPFGTSTGRGCCLGERSLSPIDLIKNFARRGRPNAGQELKQPKASYTIPWVLSPAKTGKHVLDVCTFQEL